MSKVPIIVAWCAVAIVLFSVIESKPEWSGGGYLATNPLRKPTMAAIMRCDEHELNCQSCCGKAGRSALTASDMKNGVCSCL